MSKPFFYIIQSLTDGTYYSGCRFGKDAHPDTLFRTYFTSSRQVQKRIASGERFIIRKIKVFDVAELAVDHEGKFLKRVDAKNNDKFINESNMGGQILDDDSRRKGILKSQLTRHFKQHRHPKKLTPDQIKKRRKERRDFYRQKEAEVEKV